MSALARTQAAASRAAAPARRRSSARTERIATWAAIAVGYAAILSIYLPIVLLAALSFSDRPLSGVPWPLTSRWYDELFGPERGWVAPLWRSLQVGIIVSILSTTAATIVGRALPRMQRRGGPLLAFLMPLFVPGVVIGLAIFVYYRTVFGARTGLWSLVLAHFVWAFPFSLLVLLVVSSRFDHRLLDAAADLGASAWQRLLLVELPLLKTGIVASLFFSFLLSFNELPRSIYVRGSEMTLPVYLWTQAAAHVSQVPLVFALSTIITLVSLAFTLGAVWLLLRREE
jgi:ABC-type spermidine/putrescine transport system permease subunit II